MLSATYVAESIMTNAVISVRRGNFGDSAMDKGYYFSMRMRETALFLLPVQNLASSLCFSTPTSYKAWEFRRLAII